jgi:hypothetical protein
LPKAVVIEKEIIDDDVVGDGDGSAGSNTFKVISSLKRGVSQYNMMGK